MGFLSSSKTFTLHSGTTVVSYGYNRAAKIRIRSRVQMSFSGTLIVFRCSRLIFWTIARILTKSIEECVTCGLDDLPVIVETQLV